MKDKSLMYLGGTALANKFNSITIKIVLCTN